MSSNSKDYFEHKLYDDGTYQVWQCQKRGYIPYFELHHPLYMFGKSFRWEGMFFSTCMCWCTDIENIKRELKQIKEFPSPIVEFDLSEKKE